MAGEHGHPLLLGATAGESLGKPLKLGVETWKPCGNHVETMWKVMFRGKSTMPMAIFNSCLYIYQDLDVWI